MKKHRYQEVIDFINITNPYWLPGDVGRFLTVSPNPSGRARARRARAR